MISHLSIWDMAAGQVRRVLSLSGRIEAPNWHPDGQSLLVNRDGALFAVPLHRPELLPLPTGIEGRCNNDHGFSPDGRQIAFSAHRGRGAEMFVMRATGGDARPITPLAPSWFHGWRGDGARVVYAGVRDGGGVGIYAMPSDGGAESALITGAGHHDGPDFSADGAWVYFNSDRGGHAQIWVMGGDGADARPLFSDDRVNWFPHPSPDGRHLIWLSYPPGTLGHPADLAVQIWRGDPDGTNRAPLVSFTGGQGSLNVPSWAPDSRAFAFVSYTPDQAA